MKRRDFMATGCAAGLAALSMTGLAQAEEAEAKVSPFFIDFRQIAVPNAENRKKMIEYNGKVLGPMLNKQGISPIGLFYVDAKLNAGHRNYNPKYDGLLLSAIPHATFESVTETFKKVVADPDYRRSYAAMSEGATSANPLFTSHQRALLRCFDECPKVEVPTLAEDRILQLRIYRSHSFERNRAKVEMFATGGELDAFLKYGLNPVFFSTMLFGPDIPCIVYMLSFENEQHLKDSWRAFATSEEWKALSADPKYADSATEVTSVCLRPIEGSQI